MGSPAIFHSTTSAQFTRAAAVWVTWLGIGFFPFVGAQILVWDDPGGLLISLAMMIGGGSAWWWANARIRTLHEANRPFLLSEAGPTVMRDRSRFAMRIARWRRSLLIGFVVMGTAVILAISTITCGQSIEGFCALPTVGRGTADALRWLTMATGAAYIGAVALGRAHAKETERMDVTIAEGQRRRLEGPIAGLKRSRWE